MTPVALFVIGASGHGKVVAEAALLSGLFEVLGFIDDDVSKHGTRVLGVPVVGGVDVGMDLARAGALALGIGTNQVRLSLLERVADAGLDLATVVHPSAMVAPSASLGGGTFVGPHAVVHTEAQIGRGCIINSAAVVEHDNTLEDAVHVSPNAALGGSVTLERGVHVGLGACVLPGVRIGAWAIVGAGAVVTVDVPPGSVVSGVPARQHKRRAL